MADMLKDKVPFISVPGSTDTTFRPVLFILIFLNVIFLITKFLLKIHFINLN